MTAISLALLLALSACGEQGRSQSSGKNEPQENTKQVKAQEKPSNDEKKPVIARVDDRVERLKANPKTEAGEAVIVSGQVMPAKVAPGQLQQGPDSNKRVLASENMVRYRLPIQPTGLDHGRLESRDKFERQRLNAVMVTAQTPVSTFSVDVDTGSYSTLRRWINQGRLPVKGSVRVEELVNYFAYQYPTPRFGQQPFSVNTELAPSPYNEDRMLLKIGLKGYEMDKSQLGASNLVYLLDVSGSMSSQDKLPLLKTALKLLSQQLSAQDRVSVVVYAGAAGVVLDGVKGNDNLAIAQALDTLSAGGSTNGGAGIQQAYRLAEKHFIPSGVNRVILATDGDFNVGISSHQALIDLIEAKREKGIALTTLGFGQGNYNDHLMEQLADKGNGHYAYIDTLNEARKVLVDEIGSTLLTIAKDVKVQIEFNPALVAEYRLIGYENRLLNREDFNNDSVDAGEIGAGHRVTALYELTYVDSVNRANDSLRYGDDKATENETYPGDEIAFLKLRYKLPKQDESQLISYPILQSQGVKRIDQTSDDFRFAAAVAGLGLLVNKSQYVHDLDYEAVVALGKSAVGDDPFGYRHEFIQLAQTAALLDEQGPWVGEKSEPIRPRR